MTSLFSAAPSTFTKQISFMETSPSNSTATRFPLMLTTFPLFFSVMTEPPTDLHSEWSCKCFDMQLYRPMCQTGLPAKSVSVSARSKIRNPPKHIHWPERFQEFQTVMVQEFLCFHGVFHLHRCACRLQNPNGKRGISRVKVFFAFAQRAFCREPNADPVPLCSRH